MKSRAGYFEIVGVDCAALEKDVIQKFLYCTDQYRSLLPMLVFASLTQTFSDPPLNLIDPETKEKREVKQAPFQGKLDEKTLFSSAVYVDE